MTWRLRRATLGDSPGLSLVASAAFLDAYAGVLNGADIIGHCARNNNHAVFETWLSDPQTVVTLAEYEPGHAPIGYTVLTSPDFPIDTDAADIELRRIYTLKQFHGGGVGQGLLRQACDDAKAGGHMRMLLGVWAKNVRARRFYERAGFEVVGSRSFAVGDTLYEDPVYALRL